MAIKLVLKYRDMMIDLYDDEVKKVWEVLSNYYCAQTYIDKKLAEDKHLICEFNRDELQYFGERLQE